MHGSFVVSVCGLSHRRREEVVVHDGGGLRVFVQQPVEHAARRDMRREKRIGVFDDESVARLGRRQVAGNIAHFQDQHPVSLERVPDARRKGGVL